MEYKPDFERLEPYYRAFWAGQALDRVALCVYAPQAKNGVRSPAWINHRDFWAGNTEELLDRFETFLAGRFYGALAVPSFRTQFGPDFFSALLGAEIDFSGSSSETSWVRWRTLLPGYDDLSRLVPDSGSPLYRRYRTVVEAAVERSRGRWLVGLPDLHAGFDALCVLRGGPEQGAVDLVENPDGVRRALARLFEAWRAICDDTFRLAGAGRFGSADAGIWGPGRTGIVQSDLSCLVSPRMFRECLLPEISAEINHLDNSLYHLDGPEALGHLDALLEIPSLDAIQWVRGARHLAAGVEPWLPLYQRIQARGKAIQVFCEPREVELVTGNLKPEGLMLFVYCDEFDEAQTVMSRLGWR